MREELWVSVLGCERKYIVSNLGRLKSLLSARNTPWKEGPRLLAPRSHTGGYSRVSLHRKDAFIHRVVLESFVGPCPEGCQAAHLDGSKTNNSLENLAWVTPKVNQSHRIEHGTAQRGDAARGAKLSSAQVRSIRDGKFDGLSQSTLGQMFGVSPSAISLAVTGKNWRHI